MMLFIKHVFPRFWSPQSPGFLAFIESDSGDSVLVVDLTKTIDLKETEKLHKTNQLYQILTDWS